MIKISGLETYLDPNISTAVRELLAVRIHPQLEFDLSLELFRPDETLLDQPLGELGRGVDQQSLHLQVQLGPLGLNTRHGSLRLGHHRQSWE